LSEARQQEMLLTYQQTIQQAFRGVSDSLIGYQKSHEFRQHQEELVAAAQDAAPLSESRYRSGATNYVVKTRRVIPCSSNNDCLGIFGATMKPGVKRRDTDPYRS